MGLTDIVDINNYPGPKHVIDMSDQLALTKEQVIETKKLIDFVIHSTIDRGKEFLYAENELVNIFENGNIDENILRTKLDEIEKLRSEIRFIHLNTYLQMKQILTSYQINKYYELRRNDEKLKN